MTQDGEETQEEINQKAADKNLFAGKNDDPIRLAEIRHITGQNIGHFSELSILTPYNTHSKLSLKEQERKASATLAFIMTMDTQDRITALGNALTRAIDEDIKALEAEIAAQEALLSEIECELDEIKAKLALHETPEPLEEKQEEIEELKEKTEALETQQEELKEEIEDTEKQLDNMEEEREKLDRHINHIENRHEYMNGKYYLFGVGKFLSGGKSNQESIMDVSKDPNRIVRFEGHEVSYDTDTQKLYYNVKDPETGKTIQKDVPPADQARLWHEAYENDLIFANEKLTWSNAWGFVKTRTFSNLETAGLKTTIAQDSEEQKSILEKLQTELTGTQEEINTTIKKVTSLNMQMQFIKAQEQDLKNIESPEALKSRQAELEQRKKEIEKELEENRKKLEEAKEWKKVVKDKDNLTKLDKALHNDNTRTITKEELDELKEDVPEHLHDRLLKTLDKYGAIVENNIEDVRNIASTKDQLNMDAQPV